MLSGYIQWLAVWWRVTQMTNKCDSVTWCDNISAEFIRISSGGCVARVRVMWSCAVVWRKCGAAEVRALLDKRKSAEIGA